MNQSKQKELICFISESGGGKSTLANMLNQKYNIPIVKSFTARQPRFEGESDYYFSDEATYKQHKEQGIIFEETMIPNLDVDGVLRPLPYWITENEMDFEGRKIFICDTVGIEHVKEKLTDAVITVVYVKTDKLQRFNRLKEEFGKNKALERLARDNKIFSIIPANWILDNNQEIEITFSNLEKVLGL